MLQTTLVEAFWMRHNDVFVPVAYPVTAAQYLPVEDENLRRIRNNQSP
jgi:hypothetical protein